MSYMEIAFLDHKLYGRPDKRRDDDMTEAKIPFGWSSWLDYAVDMIHGNDRKAAAKAELMALRRFRMQPEPGARLTCPALPAPDEHGSHVGLLLVLPTDETLARNGWTYGRAKLEALINIWHNLKVPNVFPLTVVMPCGCEAIWYNEMAIPEADMPCGCGSPNHWFFKIERRDQKTANDLLRECLIIPDRPSVK